jgi:hypothetical protein
MKIITNLFIFITFLFLISSARSQSAKDVAPIFEFSQDVSSGGQVSYLCYFGYNNASTQTISIPLGPQNQMNTSQHDGAQPTTFSPGRQYAVFSVLWDGNGQCIWKLGNSNAKADPPTSSQTGQNGGLESEGSLAILLARREFNKNLRLGKEQVNQIFTNNIKCAGLQSALSDSLIRYIPKNGPFSTTPFVSTPTDLPFVTNATDVIGVDYKTPQNQILGALLGLITENGKVYGHTKPVCDRLRSTKLTSISYIKINEKPFILSKLEHYDGSLDYSISFIVYKENDVFVIDNKWNLWEYPSLTGKQIFNFQVWAVSEGILKNLSEQLLKNMKAVKDTLIYKNNDNNIPGIPKVYIQDAYYKNGKFYFNLVNNDSAGSLTFEGDYAKIEDGSRETFSKIIQISNSSIYQLEFDLGFPIFDAGFSLTNNRDATKDQLYLADGPWSYTKDGQEGSINFVINPQTSVKSDISKYFLERNISVSGSIKTYFNFFRFFKPGAVPVNLNDYKFIEFAASGNVKLEIVFQANNKNYKNKIDLTSNSNKFKFDLNSFLDSEGKVLDPSNISTLLFNPIGDQINLRNFQISISDIAIGGKSSTDVKGITENSKSFELINNYPNPFNPQTTIQYIIGNAKDNNEIFVKMTIYNILGEEVKTLVTASQKPGQYSIVWNGTDNNNRKVTSGTYIYRITAGNNISSKVMLLLK